MPMRLESGDVRTMLVNMIADCGLYGCEGKDAEAMVHYIAGMTDMANAVICAIEGRADNGKVD